MKNISKIIAVATVVMLATALGACERKTETQPQAKVVKTEKVIAAPAKAAVVAPVNLQSLDNRVSLLEKRNAEIDAAVRAKRARAVPAK